MYPSFSVSWVVPGINDVPQPSVSIEFSETMSGDEDL